LKETHERPFLEKLCHAVPNEESPEVGVVELRHIDEILVHAVQDHLGVAIFVLRFQNN